MNVLIVDDQPEVVQGMVSGVNWKQLGIDRVFLAYSVKEAKGIFENETVDILLCDIEMPPTNGFELLRWIQQRQPEIASIFLSAHAEFEYAQEAVKLGSFDYILQPAPYEEIEEAVSSAIGRVQKNERLARFMVENNQKEEAAESKLPPDSGERMPVQLAIDYIRAHLDRELNRTEIAEAVYLNPEYLSHVFRKKTGKSLSEFIISEKCSWRSHCLPHQIYRSAQWLLQWVIPTFHISHRFSRNLPVYRRWSTAPDDSPPLAGKYRIQDPALPYKVLYMQRLLSDPAKRHHHSKLLFVMMPFFVTFL